MGHRCDEVLKKLCDSSVDGAEKDALFPDIVNAVRDAYKWNLKHLQRIFVEFTWAARRETCSSDQMKALFRSLPEFSTELLNVGGASNWLEDPVWAPKAPNEDRPGRCVQCGRITASGFSHGGVYDPFSMTGTNQVGRGWCLLCSRGDTIPWRVGKDQAKGKA